MHNVVCLVVVADHLTAVFKNTTPDAFNVVERLASIDEGLCDDGKSLANEEVLLHAILETSLHLCTS